MFDVSRCDAKEEELESEEEEEEKRIHLKVLSRAREVTQKESRINRLRLET